MERADVNIPGETRIGDQGYLGSDLLGPTDGVSGQDDCESLTSIAMNEREV